MRAVAAGLSNIGRTRNQNEDKFVLVPQHSVFVVADGMGGHKGGEVASRLAASSIAGYFRTADGEPVDTAGGRLLDAITSANARIFARGEDSRVHRGMGTTVVAAVFGRAEATLYIAHAGDSRCYRLRGNEFAQLTRDHSLVAEALLERPDLHESDLAYLPKNVITRALGIAPTVDIDLRAERVEIGDVFLLCSDGLHGLVTDLDIATLIGKSPSLTEACARLVHRANENGGRDNITAVLIRIEADDEPWSARGSLAPPSGR